MTGTTQPRQLAEQLLEESLEDLYEHAPCGYISTFPDGVFAKVNQTFLTWTGYERNELLAGKRFQDLLTVGGRIFYETHYTPLLHMQGFVNEIAFDLLCHDGCHLPVLINSVQKRDASGTPLLNRTTIFNAINRREYERELLRARKTAEQATERITRLQAVIVALAEALTPVQVAEVIVHQAVAALQAQAGLVAIVTDDGASLELVHAVGYPVEVLVNWQHFLVDTPMPLTDAVRAGEPILLESPKALADRYPEDDRYPFRNVVALCLAYFATFGAELAVVTILPDFFADTWGLGPAAAGGAAAGFAFMNLVARPGGGLMSDLLGSRRRTLVALCGGVVGGFLLLATLGPTWPWILAVVACMVCSFFVQAGAGAVFAIVPLVKKRVSGQIAGLAGAYGNVGAIVFLTVGLLTSTRILFLVVAGAGAMAMLVARSIVEPEHSFSPVLAPVSSTGMEETGAGTVVLDWSRIRSTIPRRVFTPASSSMSCSSASMPSIPGRVTRSASSARISMRLIESMLSSASRSRSGSSISAG